ncbi:hypothetical protein ACF0H5_018348 [Mactra antiquata]
MVDKEDERVVMLTGIEQEKGNAREDRIGRLEKEERRTEQDDDVTNATLGKDDGKRRDRTKNDSGGDTYAQKGNRSKIGTDGNGEAENEWDGNGTDGNVEGRLEETAVDGTDENNNLDTEEESFGRDGGRGAGDAETNTLRKRRLNDEVERSQKSRRIEEELHYVDDIELTEEIIEEVSRSPSQGSTVSGVSTSTSSSTVSISSTMAEKQFKDRAFELLKKGCMPFCPPARRNWKSVQPIDMGSSLSWPPKDYEKMKPDAKLLEREFVVMFIEKVGTPVNHSRKELLDKYNFLALDGEGETKGPVDEEDKIMGKIRQYNYAFLRGIVSGKQVG